MNEKQCATCKQILPATEFVKETTKQGYRLSWECKPCRNARYKEWYYKNREKVIQDVRSRQKKNPERLLENKRKWYQNNQANGKCLACPKDRLPNSNHWCEFHYYANIAHANLGTNTNEMVLALRQKMIDQDYICPYTGTHLVLALNCHLDHIMPRGRYPELGNRLDNVEWVRSDINFAKGNLTPEEFIAICKKINNYQEDKNGN